MGSRNHAGRSHQPPLVGRLHELAGCELLDLSAYDTTIYPLAFGPVPSNSWGDTAGEW